MDATPRILIYTPAEQRQLIDSSILLGGGYEVETVTHPQAIETWLNTFLDDTVLLIAHPEASAGLSDANDLLKNHPYLPIILISEEYSLTFLKQALEIGLVDYLPSPVIASELMLAIQRGFQRIKSWRESNRSAQILSALTEGVILASLDGRVLMVNQAARGLFEAGEAQLEEKPLSEVFHHPDLIDLFSRQRNYPYRSEITLDDGRCFSAQASLIANIGIVAVFQDITHHKELDRIKTEFVNTVSHDLRSPLTAIYGFVGLIDRVGPVNEQQADFIRHIQASVQHITSLINDLLELGRIEADYDIQMQDVDMVDIVRRSTETLDYQMSEKMQELALLLPQDIPVILGNPNQLQRMVINLVDNAIKFTPPLGKIRVECRAEASQLILEVADDGIGIPLEDQPHVFKKFYRGSNSSENSVGTGLGLSIVKSIVEKHHARIWLESSDAGTTFTVIFPTK